MKRILGLVMAGLLLVGMVGCQTTGSTPPAETTVEQPANVMNIVLKEKRNKSGTTSWNYINIETEYMTFKGGQRLELDNGQKGFTLVFGIASDTALQPVAVWDERGTKYNMVKSIVGERIVDGKKVYMSGMAILFDAQYPWLYTNIPSNPFYVKFADKGVYKYEMTREEWNDMISVVIHKKGTKNV